MPAHCAGVQMLARRLPVVTCKCFAGVARWCSHPSCWPECLKLSGGWPASVRAVRVRTPRRRSPRIGRVEPQRQREREKTLTIEHRAPTKPNFWAVAIDTTTDLRRRLEPWAPAAHSAGCPSGVARSATCRRRLVLPPTHEHRLRALCPTKPRPAGPFPGRWQRGH
jgi:hypothetical protein